MAKGTVKWFNPTKGYGFIQPSNGGKDVFVHISAVQKAGLSTLNEGQTIEYEEIANRGKMFPGGREGLPSTRGFNSSILVELLAPLITEPAPASTEKPASTSQSVVAPSSPAANPARSQPGYSRAVCRGARSGAPRGNHSSRH